MFELEKMNQKFDYSLVDCDTADFLRSCEYEINGIAEDARVKIGGVLKRAQEKLANNHKGVFQKWLQSSGITKDNAYYYIKVFELSRNLDDSKKDNFLNAPKSLQVEVMKKNAPEELKERVFDGEITTHKEYKELQEKLKNEQKAREQAEKMALFEQKEREKLEKELNSQKPLVKEVIKEVEIIKEVDKNEDEMKRLRYENSLLKENEKSSEEIIRSYEESYQQLKEKEEEHEKLRKQVEAMTRGQSEFSKEMESTIIAAKMNGEVRAFFMEVMSPLKYQLHLSDISHNETAKESIEETLNLLKRWTDEIEGFIGNKNKRNNTIIIEG